MSYDLTRMPEIAAALDSFERDCAITVALKISDESCKMDAYEKSVFLALYKALPEQSSDFFDTPVFSLIDNAERAPSAQIFARIKPLREAAMETITRPKMKAFKAHIRQRLSS